MTAVIVVAKAPVAGRVKTRLTPPLTPDEACAVATAALADTLDAAAACGADRKVLALDGRPGPWLPPGFEVVAQGAGGLDERLARVWTRVGGPAVQVGMDTPQVTGGELDHALAALDRSDAALGLAEDGGWWAIALRAAHPRAFLGVPMSSAGTGAAQLLRLASLRLTVTALPTRRDIDDVDDLRAVAAAAPDTATGRLVPLLTSLLASTGGAT
jgi:glycosyltransferase A (GT-A) superfamily protein (DUF2064 family)